MSDAERITGALEVLVISLRQCVTIGPKLTQKVADHMESAVVEIDKLRAQVAHQAEEILKYGLGRLQPAGTSGGAAIQPAFEPASANDRGGKTSAALQLLRERGAGVSTENKPRYFSYDPECGFDTHDTAEEARDEAEEALSCYRDNAGDGWSEHVENVCWGVILSEVGETERRPRTDEDGCSPDCEFVVDYDLTFAADPFKELSELRHVAWVLKQACKTAIAQLKGREHDEFLRLAIAAADAAGIKS